MLLINNTIDVINNYSESLSKKRPKAVGESCKRCYKLQNKNENKPPTH